MPFSRQAVLTLVALVALLTAGCTTAPIDVNAGRDPSSAHLRDGERIATLPHADPVPIENDPAAGPQADRIIALDRNGTLGAIVWALGLGSHAVGRDRSTTFPAAQGLPVVTDAGHSINVEKVLAQHPTIVLADRTSSPNGVLDQLREAQIHVVEFTDERSVAGTGALITTVAGALGAPEAGQKLTERTQREITQARRSLPDPTGDPIIAFLYIRGDRLILLAGPDSGADDLIENLGARDAGTAGGLTAAFSTVSTESLLRIDPEVILVMTQGAESVGGLDKVAQLPAVAGTRAGKAKRIIAMDETQILAFGPDTGLILQSLGKAIYR
ncbi:ABC transporter substrate-binding protein [Gordonia sp. PP30]|uniref:heme/hemin ABC transporter substrate-binding protein n=1 Tax=Gordonia sp. PP30 TaxID=2935861 RepID=UPI00200027FB|nr:ABC transporter substrate-binding protein [Gordonia sp. PP30]UQE76651.1 ABC transporter substrate-binding protein [Gordonia sp. PP30]